MPNLTTTYFRVHTAQQLYESLAESANTIYYIYAAGHTAWANTPLTPADTIAATSFEAFDNMLFGKQVTSSDIKIMAARHDWTSNTVYAKYDDADEELFSNNFFTVVDANTSFYVFKCLNNANGAPSTAQPDRTATSADDEYYATADGYQWKYLYTVDRTTFLKFATDSYMPIVADANVTGNAVSGTIDTIIVSSAGSNYNSYANGTLQDVAVGGNTLTHAIDSTASSNNSFYVNNAIKIVSGTGAGQQRTITAYTVSGTSRRVVVDEEFVPQVDLTSTYEISPHVVITGDGSGARARALVNATSNSIYSVEINARGNSYTWAEATVLGNTGTVDVGNTVVLANSAVLRPIIGPPGGHGANLEFELAASAVGISVKFSNTESSTIPASGNFHTIGLLRDPLWANVMLTIANVEGTFTVGESVTQDTDGATGTITLFSSGPGELTLTNVSGSFAASNTDLVRGATSNATGTIQTITISDTVKGFTTFDQRWRFNTIPMTANVLTINESVVQTSSNANGVVHYSNTTFTALTNTHGTFNVTEDGDYTLQGQTSAQIANVSAIIAPDLVKGSGRVLYVETMTPVTRSNTRAETVKLVISL